MILKLSIGPVALLIEVVDFVGQPPYETEALPFCDGECGAFVPSWTCEDAVTTQRELEGLFESHRRRRRRCGPSRTTGWRQEVVSMMTSRRKRTSTLGRW